MNKLICNRSNMHFFSQHEAQSFIEKWQSNNYIKKCSHIFIRKDDSNRSASGSYFTPWCKKGAFDFRETSTQYQFYGCPSNCHFYEPRWKGKVKLAFSFISKLLKNFYKTTIKYGVGIAKWYSSLATLVQVMIVVAIILIFFGPEFMTQIAAIIKTIIEK